MWLMAESSLRIQAEVWSNIQIISGLIFNWGTSAVNVYSLSLEIAGKSPQLQSLSSTTSCLSNVLIAINLYNIFHENF